MHDTVRVNEKVGDGKVKITLSFADWKGERVAPTTIETVAVKSAPSVKK